MVIAERLSAVYYNILTIIIVAMVFFIFDFSGETWNLNIKEGSRRESISDIQAADHRRACGVIETLQITTATCPCGLQLQSTPSEENVI